MQGIIMSNSLDSSGGSCISTPAAKTALIADFVCHG
jgi:hypothetical protein